MPTDTRPNIIFLMDDQHRWDALGCVNPVVQTPNLDALAADGVRFGQAVCQAPVCVPSRYAMMLGLYPSQVGVRNNYDYLTDAALPAAPLAQQLRDAGYQTAGFGKTHWSAPGESTRGFEVRAVGQPRASLVHENGAVMMDDDPAGEAALARYFKEVEAGEECLPGYEGYPSRVAGKHHRDGWVTDKCVDFVRGREDDRPLFLYLSLIKPHAACNVPDGFEQLYALEDVPAVPVPDWAEEPPGHHPVANRYLEHFRAGGQDLLRRARMYYWANVTWIDSLFGQALEALRARGLLENSLIVYCSDHGDMMGERFYRYSKESHYDPSVRVPIMLSGTWLPASLRGTVDERPAELTDLLPTVLEAAGLEAPPVHAGQSLLRPCARSGAYSEIAHGRYPYRRVSCMWRRPDAKLILWSDIGGDGASGIELYDLAKDPHEYVNLAEDPAYAGLRASMLEDLALHRLRTFSACPAPTPRHHPGASIPPDVMRRFQRLAESLPS